MDSLTQAVLGAAVYGAGMGRYQKRKALAVGAALGTLPDLDVFIRYADPISSMTYHRGFSHSLLLLLPAAWLIAWVVFRLNPQRAYSFRRLYWSIALALITHPLIDAMTMYGTQLWWPFASPPVSWATVFIIDPLYTLPMLAACLYALRRGLTDKAVKYLYWSVLAGAVYFAAGFAGKAYHEQRVSRHFAAQGIEMTRIASNPTPFNTLLWRVFAQDAQGNFYEAYSGYFDKQPPEWRKMPMNAGLAQTVWHDAPLLRRLHWFTDGWLAYEVAGDRLIVSDLRMGYAGRKSFGVFVVAERRGGRWQAVLPEKYSDGRPRVEQGALAKLWRRIRGQGSLLD